MIGFIGEYHHTIDKKGRMSIPAKFREALGDQFILAQGTNGCIFAYPLDEWEKIVANVTEGDNYSKQSNLHFVRQFFSSANDVEIDAMGRILIGSNLREYADLVKDVTVVGVLKRVEIWATERWDAYKAQGSEEVDLGAGMECFNI